MSSLYDPTEMKVQVNFPVGIISYRTASDGGKGDQHMWAIVRYLDSQGITTYCGLMVRSESWQKEWYGKMYQVRAAEAPARLAPPRSSLRHQFGPGAQTSQPPVRFCPSAPLRPTRPSSPSS